MTDLITPQELRRLLRYEPETGKLFWLERPRELFSSARACSVWNARYAGEEALTYSLRNYRYGRLFNRSISAHRAAWAIHHGHWPEHVDHINGDRSDNRISNLRSVSRTENNRNARLPKNNRSGVVGVVLVPESGRWAAFIGHQGRKVDLGRFAEKADAITARKTAERELGYHPNHGRAA